MVAHQRNRLLRRNATPVKSFDFFNLLVFVTKGRMEFTTKSLIKLLNGQVATMILVLLMIQLARLFDMTSPKTIMLLRIGYLVSQGLQLAFWCYLRMQIKARKAPGTVQIQEPANPLTGQPARTTTVSTVDYDLGKTGEQLQQLVIGSVLLLVLHAWFGFVQPLFLQIILPWKNLLGIHLVQIYVFGWKAEGELKRPFKTPNPLEELMGGGAAAEPEEKKEVEAASEGSSGPESSSESLKTEQVLSARRRNNKKNKSASEGRKED